MKKILAILLTLVLMVSVLPMGLFTITASAASVSFTVETDKARYEAGDTVVITATLKNACFQSMGVEWTYDTAVLKCVDAKWCPGATLKDFDFVNNRAVMTFDDEKAFSGDIFTMTFEVLEGVENTECLVNFHPTIIDDCGDTVYCPDAVAVVNVSEIITGTTGDCTWTLDGTVLTISGNGEMGDYYFDENYIVSLPWGTSITEVVIKDGVTSMGACAFYHCLSLNSITIPDSVISIGEYAFSYCTSLNSVTIPDGVTSIGAGTFSVCESLTSITIPDSVTSIGDSAFFECTSLIDIAIPGSVKSIGYWAFGECRSLTSLTIGDGLTSIGEGAFSHCSKLTSISIPDSVTSIGEEAFESTAYYNNSSNWENGALYIGSALIRVSESVSGSYIIKEGTTIVADSFSKYLVEYSDEFDMPCIGIDYIDFSELYIPKSVKHIGKYSFFGCESLENIYYNGTEVEWDAITIGDGNDPLLSADIKFLGSFRMVKEGSVRHEGVDKNGNYQSAGIRFKSRVSSEFRKSATELGFVAVPTALLGNMTIAEYMNLADNQALVGKVKGEGMKEIVYAVSTDANGQKYYDYQMMIKGLTREGVAENLLDTEITVAMYAIVDGETVYTDTMSYSYNWFVAMTSN